MGGEKEGNGNLADEVGGANEAFGAPERVIEIRAVGLELRREPAVDHRAASDLAEEVPHQRLRVAAPKLHRISISLSNTERVRRMQKRGVGKDRRGARDAAIAFPICSNLNRETAIFFVQLFTYLFPYPLLNWTGNRPRIDCALKSQTNTLFSYLRSNHALREVPIKTPLRYQRTPSPGSHNIPPHRSPGPISGTSVWETASAPDEERNGSPRHSLRPRFLCSPRSTGFG
ncbi:hypothetical protein BHE74_00022427 [Ensete ventricosum]|nr:hypothetical protein BHE74_00022427 [Ensete ventricosum]